MLINMSLLKYVTLVLLISSCQTSKNVSSVNSGESNSYKVASLKKTSCYGSCPVYEVTFYSNLEVEFVGEKNVDNVGKYTSRITQQQLKNIQDSFSKSNFFDFDEEYTSAVSDLPTTFIYFSDGQKSMTVKDYTGAPENLKSLEKLLEDYVNTLKWEIVQEK